MRVWSKIDAECLALGNVQVRVGTLLQSSVRSLDASQLDLLLAQHSTKLVESEAVLTALFAESDKCVAALDAAISQHQGGLGSQLQARFVVVDALRLEESTCKGVTVATQFKRALNAERDKRFSIIATVQDAAKQLVMQKKRVAMAKLAL